MTKHTESRERAIRVDSPSSTGFSQPGTSASSARSNTDAPPLPLVRVRLVRPGATVPSYQTSGAAGMDLSACTTDGLEVEISPGAIRLIPCGIAIAIPRGFEGQVRPRSGLASRHGVTLPNAPGTLDSDYRGEVIVPLINHGKEAFVVTPGMRIAQMVIAPVTQAHIQVCDELDSTERGGGGFGSTGL